MKSHNKTRICKRCGERLVPSVWNQYYCGSCSKKLGCSWIHRKEYDKKRSDKEYRENRLRKPIVVAVSGGMDPLHIGHIRHFKAAKELGDKLIVILNSDNFLKKKKGFVFMPYEERKEIIDSIKYVDEVVECIDKDNTVANTLAIINPDIFAKGGDRGIDNIPKKEREVCEMFDIKIINDVGEGGKIQSSSWLIDKIKTKRSLN